MSWPAQETALVTGAASGMGLGISRALVAAGARVALVDINAERLAAAVEELTAAGGEVLALEFDVSDPEAWQGAADRAEEALGPVSIVCSRVLGISGQPVHGLGRNRHQALATSTLLPSWESDPTLPAPMGAGSLVGDPDNRADDPDR
jgi:NAD(P)-dependent dehydrogenase (short-subunit alcohol dehydrogenase family)